MNAILVELEARLRSGVRSEEKTLPDMGQLDVDHILPQSWYAHWPLSNGSKATQTEAAEVRLQQLIGGQLNERQKAIATREACIPTLGNLTLLNLSVNREAQNFAFTRKRDLLIANTALRLNIPQVSLVSWDEGAVAKRGALLANAALETWPGPRS